MKIDVTKLQPTPGYVVVKGAEKEAKTASGIILPTDGSEKPVFGEVLAVGASVWENGVREVSAPVKKGDLVFYKKWGGNEIEIGEETYQILKFEDILAVVK